jgi:hypothetical protein
MLLARRVAMEARTMTTLRLAIVAITACMAATGCTSPTAPPPVAPAAVQQPSRPVSVNGIYNGVTQLVEGAAMSCGTQDILTLRVVDNAFDYTLNQPQVPWQPARSFHVPIRSDGSFQSQSGAAFIRGTVSNGHMAGDIVGDACSYHFEADSSGTF